MYTVDTNAVIYYLQNDPSAVSFFDRVSDLRIPVYISAISETELLSYPPLTEQDVRAIEDVLGFCIITHTNPRITQLAGEMRRMYRIKTVDALIAATALFNNSTLITRNVRDFAHIKELAVEKI
jgi:predicted nucleic acid-binding protein